MVTIPIGQRRDLAVLEREVARDRGLEVYEWRPADWIDGKIETILRGDR